MKTLISAVFATTLAGPAFAAPVQWTTASGGNGHWYDFVVLTDGISATAAETAAEGSSWLGEAGYLATITSAAEQSFLNTLWPGAGSVTGQFNDWSYFLIGHSDRDTEGDFQYIGGPEEGTSLTYTNWASFEPNNTGNEDYAVAWWLNSASGLWNDTIEGAEYRAYLVEYNEATTSPVPLPAGLPLMLAGLGGLALVRRRATGHA